MPGSGSSLAIDILAGIVHDHTLDGSLWEAGRSTITFRLHDVEGKVVYEQKREQKAK